MEKFLVLYRAPNAVIDEWMKKPEQERKPDIDEMAPRQKDGLARHAPGQLQKGDDRAGEGDSADGDAERHFD